MRKKFKMQDVDCANCAAEMERNIAKLDGVNEVSISFMHQKMTIDADDARFEEILEKAQECVSKVDEGAKILR